MSSSPSLCKTLSIQLLSISSHLMADQRTTIGNIRWNYVFWKEFIPFIYGILLISHPFLSVNGQSFCLVTKASVSPYGFTSSDAEFTQCDKLQPSGCGVEFIKLKGNNAQIKHECKSEMAIVPLSTNDEKGECVALDVIGNMDFRFCQCDQDRQNCQRPITNEQEMIAAFPQLKHAHTESSVKCMIWLKFQGVYTAEPVLRTCAPGFNYCWNITVSDGANSFGGCATGEFISEGVHIRSDQCQRAVISDIDGTVCLCHADRCPFNNQPSGPQTPNNKLFPILSPSSTSKEESTSFGSQRQIMTADGNINNGNQRRLPESSQIPSSSSNANSRNPPGLVVSGQRNKPKIIVPEVVNNNQPLSSSSSNDNNNNNRQQSSSITAGKATDHRRTQSSSTQQQERPQHQAASSENRNRKLPIDINPETFDSGGGDVGDGDASPNFQQRQTPRPPPRPTTSTTVSKTSTTTTITTTAEIFEIKPLPKNIYQNLGSSPSDSVECYDSRQRKYLVCKKGCSVSSHPTNISNVIKTCSDTIDLTPTVGDCIAVATSDTLPNPILYYCKCRRNRCTDPVNSVQELLQTFSLRLNSEALRNCRRHVEYNGRELVPPQRNVRCPDGFPFCIHAETVIYGNRVKFDGCVSGEFRSDGMKIDMNLCDSSSSSSNNNQRRQLGRRENNNNNDNTNNNNQNNNQLILFSRMMTAAACLCDSDNCNDPGYHNQMQNYAPSSDGNRGENEREEGLASNPAHRVPSNPERLSKEEKEKQRKWGSEFDGHNIDTANSGITYMINMASSSFIIPCFLLFKPLLSSIILSARLS